MRFSEREPGGNPVARHAGESGEGTFPTGKARYLCNMRAVKLQKSGDGANEEPWWGRLVGVAGRTGAGQG